VQFVETSAFTRRVRKLLDMEAYAGLQLHLILNRRLAASFGAPVVSEKYGGKSEVVENAAECG